MTVSRCRLPLALVCLGLVGAGGCASLGRPKWLDPGPVRNQQRKAVRFDPYLQNDIGPYSFRMPLMDGSRPRDFIEPVPEVRRSRWWSPVR
ncbi:MAG: hypothetical protein ACKO9B_10200 [Planctomycetota bacterium]|jgi:hypothetical protein|nr:hypothetical protein [Planctomycetota bacterium]